MSVAQRERAALVETLRAVGPDAPTLCEGWTTRDLAAHLVVRERRPDALPGLLFGPLASYTARLQNQLTTSTTWLDLVEMFASGPPMLSLFKVLDPVASITRCSSTMRTSAVRRLAGSQGNSTSEPPRR
jgi:uncharacterized protein (TIGR03085 family)